jgi:hypothetical protein
MPAVKQTSGTHSVSQVDAVHVDKMPADISKQNISSTSIGIASQESGTIMVPTTNVRSANAADLAAIIPSDNRGRFRLNDPQPHDDGRRSDWAIRASIGYGSTFLYVPAGSNAYASRSDANALIGLDYSLSAMWAIGVEGGWTSNQILSPTTTVINTGATSRVETHATSTTSSPLYTRLAMRFTPNPYDMVRLQLAGGGGRVFGSSGGWMAHAQAGLGFTPGSDHAWEFQVAILYSGVWSTNTSTPAAQQSAATQPIEFSTASVPSSTIFTPAFTGRIGLQYRLP